VANRAAGSAKALKTLLNRDPNALDRDLRALIEDWEPDTIVIGVPYNMDGSESRMTARAIEFATRLGEVHGLPVDRVDERLTSSEASMMLREQRRSGQRRKKVRREDIDSLAAQLIAESWLRLE
jgi:putative Holliday junction resolvase